MQLDVEGVPFVTMEDAISFMEAKGVKLDCPTCGHRNWFLQEDMATEEVYLPVNTGNTTWGSGQAVPVIAIMCQNCGFVRLHSANMIKDWVKKRGLQDER